ncbi:MAG TPA: hypothetical protein VFP00_12265 [Burkholderiales bacterium]|nr:hypothetical protein [Burkholderiales bacterium]
MADFPVSYTTTLERHLIRNGIQPWRIPALISSRGVLARRGGSALPITGPAMQLEDGDAVRVVEPPSTATLTALAQAATAGARDYAFVPGTSPFDRQMANVLTARPQTIRVTEPTIDSLTSFIRSLGRAQATAPIRHIIISSHANNQGVLFMKLDLLAAGEIHYEALEAAATAKSLAIDPAWLMPRPKDASGVDVAALFLVRGCRIGTVPAYLRKLREALGGTLSVVAPKHFHVAAQLSAPAGFVEYMQYGWGLSRPQRIRNRTEVIRAFQAGGFTRIDGTPVPATAWDGFIPRNPHGGERQTVNARVVNPVLNRRETIPAEFRFKERRPWDAEQSFALATDPGTLTGRKAAVQAELERVYPQYLPRHPYPAYTRWGFSSMQEFMDGFTWTFRYDPTSGTLYYTATRADYTVLQPVVDLATNRLFLNYYPSTSAGTVLELLSVTDARFFATA